MGIIDKSTPLGLAAESSLGVTKEGSEDEVLGIVPADEGQDQTVADEPQEESGS